MLQQLDHIDRAIFLALNACHTPWLDTCMWYISKMQLWLPVYAFLLYLLYKKYPAKQFLLVVLCVAITLVLCDRVAVELFKNTVMRLRPSHNPEIADHVHLVMDSYGHLYRGGQFGFFSNHASNYFGVATLFYFLAKPLKTWAVILLLFWVLLISYSRIYLGVHYPGDVVAGACFGMLVGWLISRLFFLLNKKYFLPA